MKTNTVTLWLRLEAAVVLAGAVAAYHWLGGSWMLFAALFLLPDVSMLAYLRGSVMGARGYNGAHSYTAPALGALAASAATGGAPSPLWLVWVAHIAFDRVAGYGLKQPESFHATHLGAIGRVSR
jgi:CHASE2 domain-containing sensor protein